MRIVVTGAGGFIGSHLVKRLKRDGHWVRGIDLVRPAWEESPADEFLLADLRRHVSGAFSVGDGTAADQVYALAADMGGIGHISRHHARLMANNAAIDLNTVAMAAGCKVGRVLYTSSACVYPTDRQVDPNAVGLAENEAWPALPEEGYGLEKLFAEKLFEHWRLEQGLDSCVVRLHNVYGPFGTWDGGREKAPAAACRKIAQHRLCAAETGDPGPVEVWGDGRATRSFMFVDDCVEGLVRLMDSGAKGPINLGTEELVSVRDLYVLAMGAAQHACDLLFDRGRPQGVRGRNSDNTLLRSTLGGWEPRTTLAEGLALTYPWIAEQVAEKAART